MRIVVLGANGQLGSRILARILQDYPEAEVLGCVRKDRMAASSKKFPFLSFDPYQDDWSTLGKVDVLINCIGIIREMAEVDFEKAHIGLTELILQHRQLLGHPKLVQLSALGADESNPSRFLRTKGIADQKLLRHPNTVVIRPSIVCTQGTMLSQKLRLIKKLCQVSFGLLPFPSGMLRTKLQPVTAADLAELVSSICLLQSHPSVVEVAGKEIYTLEQLLSLVPTCRKIIPFPQSAFNQLSPLLSRLFPSLLDREQLPLLQQDNVSITTICELILGRKMASTAAFWSSELA